MTSCVDLEKDSEGDSKDVEIGKPGAAVSITFVLGEGFGSGVGVGQAGGGGGEVGARGGGDGRATRLGGGVLLKNSISGKDFLVTALEFGVTRQFGSLDPLIVLLVRKRNVSLGFLKACFWFMLELDDILIMTFPPDSWMS